MNLWKKGKIFNFLRESGNIYARIVEKNIIEKDGNWRVKYILPNETNSSKMDDFTQKISFNTYGKNYRKGCYLLIKTLSDSKSFINITHFPFSIIIHTHEFNIINNYNMPLIKIPTDEYIVGTISEYTNNEIYQFYSVLINLDCEQILIDFQSKTGGLFINVGNEKPTTSNSNFTILLNGKDQILTIKKMKYWK